MPKETLTLLHSNNEAELNAPRNCSKVGKPSDRLPSLCHAWTYFWLQSGFRPPRRSPILFGFTYTRVIFSTKAWLQPWISTNRGKLPESPKFSLCGRGVHFVVVSLLSCTITLQNIHDLWQSPPCRLFSPLTDFFIYLRILSLASLLACFRNSFPAGSTPRKKRNNVRKTMTFKTSTLKL